MTRADIETRLTHSFEYLYGDIRPSFIFHDDLIYIHLAVGGSLKMFRIEIPSDDDGFFYAYVWNGTDYEPTCCIRIAYP